MTMALEASPEYRLRRTATGFSIYDPARSLLVEGATLESAHAALEERRRQLEAEVRAAGFTEVAVPATAQRDPEWRRFGFFVLRVAVIAAAVLFLMPSPAGVWRLLPSTDVVGRVLLDRLHEGAEVASQAKPETVATILADVRKLAQAAKPFLAELKSAYDTAAPAAVGGR